MDIDIQRAMSIGIQSKPETETGEVSRAPMRESIWKRKPVKSGESINEALRQIDNLIDIFRFPELSLALKDWGSREEVLCKRIDKKNKVVHKTRSEVSFVMAFVSGLQGLLLTAAALSSSSQCKNRGFLLAVSAFATFCALALVWHKEVTIRRLQSVIVVEKDALKVLLDILCGFAKEPRLEIPGKY